MATTEATGPIRRAVFKAVDEKEAHHRALREWLDELYAKYGPPSPEQLAEADALLDMLERGDFPGKVYVV